MKPSKNSIAIGLFFFGILATNSFAQMTWTPVPKSAEWQARFQHASVVFNKLILKVVHFRIKNGSFDRRAGMRLRYFS